MSDQAPPKSAQEITLDALREIYERTHEPVSREALISATGLPASTVDWHLRTMAASREDAVRCSAGGYRPIHRHPADRAMSFTPLDHGLWKWEIGDNVITLTPGELQKSAPVFAALGKAVIP